MNQKQVLLGTRMTELGLGYKFNKYFLRYKNNNKRYPPMEPAITLAEFFEKNKVIKRRASSQFYCAADGTGFSYQSTAFARLKVLLKTYGFTGEDWILLREGNHQLSLFSFSKMEKKDFLSRSFVTLGLVKTTSRTFELFAKAFPAKEANSITIGDILKLSQSEVDGLVGVKKLGIKSAWLCTYPEVQAFRVFITKIQDKFSRIGLNQADGPFMTITFKKQKQVPIQGVQKAA